ncbi:MAG: hypothetical protein ACLTYN_13335 [Dysosmobacter welbionis]
MLASCWTASRCIGTPICWWVRQEHDASVYKVSDDLARCRRWISSRYCRRPVPVRTDRATTPSPMCTPWAASPSCA